MIDLNFASIATYLSEDLDFIMDPLHLRIHLCILNVYFWSV